VRVVAPAERPRKAEAVTHLRPYFPASAQSKSVRRAMRSLGYQDGIAGRKAAKLDADYQASWRRGQEARAELGLPVRS
jgi:hypothetical protein